MKKTILYIILLKPILDLDWKIPILYNYSPHQIIAAVLPLVLMIFLITKIFLKGSIKVNKNYIFFILLFSITISLILNFHFFSCTQYLRTLNFIVLFFVFPELINDNKTFIKYSKYFLYILLIPTLISYCQLFGVVKFTYWDYLPGIGKIGRVSGGYRHPTGYTNYMIIAIPLLIYLFFKQNINKKFFIFWGLFTLPMIFLTFHRATIAIVLLDIILYSFFYKKNWSKYYYLLLFIIILFFSFPYIWELLNQGSSITNLHFRGRYKIWPIFWNYFSQHIFIVRIFGLGSPILPGGGNEPHSDYLRFLLNYGYLGFLLYVGGLLLVLIKFIKNFFKSRFKGKINLETLTGMVLIVSLFLYSITMEPLRYSNFSWWFSISLGYFYSSIIPPIKIKLV